MIFISKKKGGGKKKHKKKGREDYCLAAGEWLSSCSLALLLLPGFSGEAGFDSVLNFTHAPALRLGAIQKLQVS